MHDLNQIIANNARSVHAESSLTLQQQGKHVVLEYNGLHLVAVHGYGTKAQAEHKIEQLKVDQTAGVRGFYQAPISPLV